MKKKKKPKQATINRKAIADWSRQVRSRDKTCIVCGKTLNLQAHHLLFKERFPQLKLQLLNGITLCPGCHKFGAYSFHRNPIWSTLWLQLNRPNQYQWVVSQLPTIGYKATA